MSWSDIARWLRGPRVLLLVGGVLFLSGQALLVTSFFHGTAGEDLTIPPGPEWIFVYEIKVLGVGRVIGQFADPTGGLVNLHVFAESEFQAYVLDGSVRTLYSMGGPAGSFSAGLPGSGTYYLVLGHGAGSEDVAQDVHVSFHVAGIEPEFIGTGLAFVAAGIVGAGVGLWKRQRAPGPAETQG